MSKKRSPQPLAFVDLAILWFQRTLLLWLVLTSWLALMWTKWFPGRIDPFDPEVFTDNYLYIAIAVTMLAVGLLLPRDEIRQVIQRWPMVLVGTLIQYTSMPLLAYLVAKMWGFSGDQLVGVIIVGCVPGAMASNVLTMNAGGNTSYSVSLTTSATLLSPLAVPFALWATLSGDDKVTPAMLVDSSLFMLVTVVLPVMVGYSIARIFPALEKHFKRFGTITANVAILLIIAVVVGRTRGPLGDFQLGLLRALLLVNIAGYAIGYFGGLAVRLPEGMRRALTLEVGMQNAGVGTALAIRLFSDQAAIAPAIYTFGCMLTGTLLALAWSMMPVSGRGERDEPIAKK